MLIALTGRAGSGKDTAAAFLQKEFGLNPTALATPLKNAARTIFGLTEGQIYNRDLKEVVIPELGYSPRHIMQRVGDGLKLGFNENFWVECWKRMYSNDLQMHRDLSIVDLRFDYEAKAVKELGGYVVELLRDGTTVDTLAAKHCSEAGVSRIWISAVIDNNDTVEDLERRLGDLMGRLLNCEAQKKKRVA